MQTSVLVVFVSVFFLFVTVANGAGGLLISDHPVGLEVDVPGDSVTLQCSASSEGEITHWLLNGARLDPASSGVDITITPGAGGSSNLTINSYDPLEHAGEYRCVARSAEYGEEISHAAPVSHFTQRTFTTQPQDFTVYALPPLPGAEIAAASREAAAFNCEFAALPRFGRRPVILWEYEPASTGLSEILGLSGSAVMSTFQYDHTGYFQFHAPGEFDDESRVRCLAQHPEDPSQQVESQWASITISNASLPADFPVFTTRMPSEMHHIEGQQLVLGCSKSTPTTSTSLQWIGANGIPFFTVGSLLIFLRSDVVVYGASNIRVKNDSLESVVSDTFTCRAIVSGVVKDMPITIVPPPPPLPPLTYNDQFSSFPPIDYGFPAVSLRAENYTGRVSWWFNGEPISSNQTSQKYSISPDTLSLTVSNLVLNDSGQYQADLIDASPPQLLNFQLTVRGSPAFALPLPSEQLTRTVDVGTFSVLFDCLTDGNVPPVTSYLWSFEGERIIQDGSKYILCPNGSLVVYRIQLSDAGVYSCEPQNALGSFNSSSGRLMVNVPGSPPDVPRISYVGIIDETSIFVNWTALEGAKNYTLEIRTYYKEKEGEERNPDDSDKEKVKILMLDTNKHIISEAGLEVVYLFRVRASNDFGRSRFSNVYEFDPESVIGSGSGQRRSGLRGWEIALIVIFIILLLLLCCIFCLCLCLCWRREKRSYHAAKKEKAMRDKGVEAYRQTGDQDNKDD